MDIKQFLRSPKLIEGIEICTTPSGTRVFCCTLKKDKSNIQFINKKEITLHELETHLATVKHDGFRISLSGKGILVQNSGIFSETDFIVQELDNTHFILRKDGLDLTLTTLTKDNIKFSGYVFGGSLLKWAKTVLKEDNLQSFCYTSEQFEKANWDLLPQNIKIGLEEISSEYVGAYLCGLTGFLEGSFKTASDEQEKMFFENLAYKKLILFSGLFFGLFALGNFFYFNHLNSHNQLLSEDFESKSELQEEFLQTNEDLNAKTKLLDDLGGMKKLFQSYYTDQIAVSVPKSVLLTEISVAPLDKELFKKDKQIQFDKKSIFIQGKTNSAIDFNKWLDQLKSNTWIEKVEIENYHFDSQINQSIFNLNLSLK